MKSVSKYLSQIGQRGGKATSQAKAKAARANGAKGGRPRTPFFQIEASCPACGKTVLLTAVSIRPTGKLVYECASCGTQNDPHRVQQATAARAGKAIVLPRMLGEILPT